MRKTRARARKRSSLQLNKTMPKLSDYKKGIPKGGLLNPGLRKGGGMGVGSGTKINAMKKPKGNFKNIGL